MGNLLGAVDVRRSATGLEFSVDKGVTWTAVGGAGGSTLDTALLAFAQSNYATINRFKASEMEWQGGDYGIHAVGPNNGTATNVQSKNGGAVQLQTNAAGSGGILVIRSNQAVPNPISQNAKTDAPWFIAAVMSFPATVDSNTLAALSMETISFSAACSIGMNGGVSTTNYDLALGATHLNTGVALDLSGALVLLILGFDGTTMKAWKSTPNGILTTAPTLLAAQTDLTNVQTGQSCGMVQLSQGAAIASKSLFVDYMFEAWVGAA